MLSNQRLAGLSPAHRWQSHQEVLANTGALDTDHI